MLKKDEAKLFSVLHREEIRGDGHKMDYKKSHLNVRKDICFYSKDGQRLEQVRDVVELNILGDTQNPVGDVWSNLL